MNEWPMQINYQELAEELNVLADGAESAEDLMSSIVERLSKRLPHFNWVGFYMIESDEAGDPVLSLGPYAGAETPHKRIPLNQGICGAAVSSGQTLVVDDVNADTRYLACSLETKSEIVAPVFVRGTTVGELDIDSHTPAAFTEEDRTLVEHCAALVGNYMERNS